MTDPVDWNKIGSRKSSVIDSPGVVFSAEFLLHPPAGFTVKWPKGEPVTVVEVSDLLGGILVKHTHSGRVWRLTGETHDGPMGYFMGRWPD